jgi:hypothetical protein
MEEWWDIVWEDVGCAGATTRFISPRCNNQGAKRLGSIGTVKRCCKNDFCVIRHLV